MEIQKEIATLLEKDHKHTNATVTGDLCHLPIEVIGTFLPL